VVLHGFTLAPFARALGLSASEKPGVLIVGGSPWTTALAETLKAAEVPVLMTDPNYGNLRGARTAGLETFSGDILSEAAEQRLELMGYDTIIAATSNDAYNTLVATDLAPEFGRDNVYQVMREKDDNARFHLPQTLGGKSFGPEETFEGMNRLIRDGWTFGVTQLTEEFTPENWRAERPDAHFLGRITPAGEIKFQSGGDDIKPGAGLRILTLRPPTPVAD